MAEFEDNKKIQAYIKDAQTINGSNKNQDPEAQKLEGLELLEKYLVRTDSPTQT